MPKRYTCVKKLRLLTFGSVNYASTAGGYAAVTKGLNRYQNVSILDVIGAKDDEDGGDNWSYRTCKAPIKP